MYLVLFVIQIDIDPIKRNCEDRDRQENDGCRDFGTRLDNLLLLIHVRFNPTKPLFGKVFKTVFDKLEYEVMALLHPFGCVAETKADIIVSGRQVRDASLTRTWDETWDVLSENRIDFVSYDITIYVVSQDINIMFDNVIALLSGRIIRVVDNNINMHDFAVQIGDRLSQGSENWYQNTSWKYVEPWLSERFVIYDLSHSYNEDYSKTVVSAGSFPLYSACAKIPNTLNSVVNFMHLINCSLNNVSYSDFKWTLLNNGSLCLLNGFIFKPESFYYTSPHSIAICNTTLQEYMLSLSNAIARTNALTPEGILSVACTWCSIVCLLISLFVYILLPKLRQTLPGLNTLILICFLVVSQTLFLFDIQRVFSLNGWPCKILGLVLHFSWLCSLFWMNVCTFHMYKILARVRIINNEIASMRFMLYIGYALLMSVLFVATNIIGSYVRNGTFGYGRDDCYIDTQDMIQFTAVLPVGCVVILNFMFFILVTLNLTRTPKIKKSVKNDRNIFKILVKLSTITGLTWIFGLVYSFTGEEVLSYIFIVLNASQGVFLFFAFIATKSVVGMIRKRLCGQKKSPLSLSGKEGKARHKVDTQSTSMPSVE